VAAVFLTGTYEGEGAGANGQPVVHHAVRMFANRVGVLMSLCRKGTDCAGLRLVDQDVQDAGPSAREMGPWPGSFAPQVADRVPVMVIRTWLGSCASSTPARCRTLSGMRRSSALPTRRGLCQRSRRGR